MAIGLFYFCKSTKTASAVSLHLVFFFLMACNNGSKTVPDNPVIVDSVLSKVSGFRRGAMMHYLDTSYQRFKPGRGDIYRKYDKIRDYYFTIERDYDSATLYADSMLFIIHEPYINGQYTGDYVKALFFKGDALMALNRYEAAFALYYQAKDIVSRKMKGLPSSVGYYSRLAYELYKQRNYREAIPVFHQAFAEMDKEKDPFIRFVYKQMHLDDIGLCYSNAGIKDSALHYYNLAFDFINKHALVFTDRTDYIETAKGVVYGNMGKLLMDMGNDTAAERVLKESIALTSKPNRAEEDAQYTRERLAGFYLKRSEPKKAQQVIGNMKVWLDSVNGSVQHRERYLRLRAAALAQQGDYKNAYGDILQYLSLNDSVTSASKPSPEQDIRKQLQYLERTQELVLAKEKEQTQKLYLYIIIICLLMAVIITVLVWRLYRQSRRNVSQLIGLNKEINTRNGQMQKALEALEKSQYENTRMMKVIAHDLRNPVSAMLNFAEMQVNEWLSENEKKEMVRIMQKSGTDALSLIDDLLQTNASVKDIEKVPVELDHLLDYCVKQLQPKAAEKKQQLEFYPVQASIHADREKLWRVFSNLIANAVKFSPAQETITIRMKEDGAHIMVAVEDHGIGIPTELKEEIFNMTLTAKRKGTQGEPSFGLGLYITRQIIEAHNGKIWFENNNGCGTIFFVSLPINFSAS
ncbi:tetratricopeptide repeat-containing sensor histidine kinase [Foetidibacter luteolus]|uniref:tetratricopeptide repeat-containing sensor histidine kinase n=1 Tax=Foetidibacter luteolus TaxID=2608880 RepID=UPI00129BA704|nr:HAMP domain-containing sensor histidine kinase [Foetidibacter luteolus]